MSDIIVEYPDLVKAYQAKLSGLMNELITAEAKFNASANVVKKLDQRVEELEQEIKKLQKKSVRGSNKTTSKEERKIN